MLKPIGTGLLLAMFVFAHSFAPDPHLTGAPGDGDVFPTDNPWW
jgi:hypothetical protein